MNVAHTIARKYAQACINVFAKQISMNDFYNIVAAYKYLSTHPHIFFFLRLSAISDDIKKQALDDICDRFNLGKPIHKLIELLINDKRSFLCAQVLVALIELYKQKKHIYAFTFISSCALSAEDEEQFQAFLAKQTGYDIIYESMVDKELIAGIRLQSDTLLWEHSIRKQLHDIELQLIR